MIWKVKLYLFIIYQFDAFTNADPGPLDTINLNIDVNSYPLHDYKLKHVIKRNPFADYGLERLYASKKFHKKQFMSNRKATPTKVPVDEDIINWNLSDSLRNSLIEAGPLVQQEDIDASKKFLEKEHMSNILGNYRAEKPSPIIPKIKVFGSGAPEKGVVSAPSNGVVSAPGEGVVSVPSNGVISAPGEGVVSAPGEGVVSAPSNGVVSAPGEGVVSAPSNGVVSAPGEGVISAPSNGVVSAPGEGVISAIGGGVVSATGCMKEDNTYYAGNNINQKFTRGVDECTKWCGRIPECKFWTYNKFTTMCLLRTSNYNRTVDNDKISGSKGCATGCVKEDNTYYAGNNINQKFTQGVDECTEWCGQIPECKFWTYNKYTAMCLIKNSNYNRRRDSGKISGSKECATESGEDGG